MTFRVVDTILSEVDVSHLPTGLLGRLLGLTDSGRCCVQILPSDDDNLYPLTVMDEGVPIASGAFPADRVIPVAFATLGGTRIARWERRSMVEIPGERESSTEGLRSFVYFVRDEDGFVKIGKARDVQQRLIGLQTSSRQKLTVLAAMPGGLEMEAHLHKRFAATRVRGEWFAPSPELAAFIEAAA